MSWSQLAPFEPIRVAKAAGEQLEEVETWSARSALIATNPVDRVARTLEALLVVASRR